MEWGEGGEGWKGGKQISYYVCCISIVRKICWKEEHSSLIRGVLLDLGFHEFAVLRYVPVVLAKLVQSFNKMTVAGFLDSHEHKPYVFNFKPEVICKGMFFY